MIRIILAVAAIGAGSLAPASAQQETSPMQGAFGNTIVSVQPDGTTTRTYVDPDGTYRSITKGVESGGTWTVEKGKICYLAVGAPPLCALGPKKKAGDKWRIFLSDDLSVKVEIMAGRP